MSKGVRVCVDRVLPAPFLREAAEVAISESSRNLPDPILLGDLLADEPVQQTRPELLERRALVSLTGKRWATGRTIYWHFLDGPEWARDSVMKYASYWLYQANLTFRRTKDRSRADVRVSFDPIHGGSWSYLGTDNTLIPKDEPTMALGWYLDTDEEDRRRVALHECGHMLSFGHEQAHPEGNIPWNRPVVYDYYYRTQGWSQSEVDRQVLFRYSVGQTNFSEYDRNSIMHYSIPAAHLTDPSAAVGWNTLRSRTDKRYAARFYPKTPLAAATGKLHELAATIRG